jgi:hypothetical protein
MGLDARNRTAGCGRVGPEVFVVTPSAPFSPADGVSLCRGEVEMAREATPVVITHGTEVLEEASLMRCRPGLP